MMGALALVVGHFTEAELAALAQRFAVIEPWQKDAEGWLPTRWPLSCDAALATLAARALAEVDAALAATLTQLRASAACAPTSDTAHALATAHASVASEQAAMLLQRALDAQCLSPREVLETVKGWAPPTSSVGRVQGPNLTCTTWPGFAVLLDGEATETLPARLAKACASATSLGAMEAAFQALTEGLQGAGVVAVLQGEGIVLRHGTIESASDGTTWALALGPTDLAMAADLPLDRALNRLLPPPHAPGIAELFFGRRPETTAPRAALALVRAPAPPHPTLSPDPVALAARRSTVEALAARALSGTRGLEVHVDALPGGGDVNGALERIPTLRVRVLRDDVSNASSEADAARVVERALRQRPELGPVLVVSDYVK